jgi:hypothetical protein
VVTPKDALTSFSIVSDGAGNATFTFAGGPTGGVSGDGIVLNALSVSNVIPEPSTSVLCALFGLWVLALFAPSGTRIVQEFAPSYPPQQEDVSYSWAGYHLVSTPDAPNEEGAVAGFVADTKFNPGRGFHSEPVAVTITTATPGALIYFTTGGTDRRFCEGWLLVMRLLGADDVRLVVECSTNFYGWQPLDSHLVGISRIRVGETEEIRYQNSPSLPSPSQTFLRSRAIRR